MLIISDPGSKVKHSSFNGWKGETVEMHRIMHAFRKQEKRVAALEDKIKSRNEKIEALKVKKLPSKKSWGRK